MNHIKRGRRLFYELADLVSGNFQLLSTEFLVEFRDLNLGEQPEQFISALEKEIARIKEKLQEGGKNVYLQ